MKLYRLLVAAGRFDEAACIRDGADEATLTRIADVLDVEVLSSRNTTEIEKARNEAAWLLWGEEAAAGLVKLRTRRTRCGTG